MDLEGIMLSEISYREKKYCYQLYVESKKKNTYIIITQL